MPENIAQRVWKEIERQRTGWRVGNKLKLRLDHLWYCETTKPIMKEQFIVAGMFFVPGVVGSIIMARRFLKLHIGAISMCLSPMGCLPYYNANIQEALAQDLDFWGEYVREGYLMVYPDGPNAVEYKRLSGLYKVWRDLLVKMGDKVESPGYFN